MRKETIRIMIYYKMVRREGVVPAITKLRTVNARYTGYTRAAIFGTLHAELYWSRDTT